EDTQGQAGEREGCKHPADCCRQGLIDRSTMARKKLEAPENHERWLLSYADFITLLFAFFVVMFASSQTDKAKAQAVSDSVKKALNGESFHSMVTAVLGGAIDVKGQGNAQMKG